ncbi:MAG: putative histidine kinase, classic [Ramlibacter sp.]|jgi:two-component system OmpR family sensor kinase|nr:putative histidine kinase, classic [Ramlibacter sp.]
MIHIFPSGPMCSLRRALLLWLVPMFVLVGLVSAACAYWSYGRMVGTFMDDQMEQLALSIATNEGYAPPPGLTRERAHKWGSYVTQVFGADGRLQATALPQLAVGLQAQPGFHDLEQDGTGWRAYTTAPGASGHRVQVLQSSQFRGTLATERAGAAIAPILLLLPLSVLVLWGVVAAVSRAVQDIGRQAASQDEHHISELTLERVPHEIKPLVTSFNSLLSRLRDAFATQRRFVQDAAHELRTPITAVALQLENVRRDLPPGACAQSFTQLESGVQRAQRLVDQLLKMSRQEAAAPDPATAVDLDAQLRESINTLIGLADQRDIDLGLVESAGTKPAAALRCAPGDLRSVLDNLIENALRYTPEGGVVDVRVLDEGGRVAVEVVDNGPGIPEDMLARVFDRFFRVPGTGGRGSGLGLSIAQSAAQRCGLRIALRNRGDRSGLVARIEPA